MSSHTTHSNPDVYDLTEPSASASTPGGPDVPVIGDRPASPTEAEAAETVSTSETAAANGRVEARKTERTSGARSESANGAGPSSPAPAPGPRRRRGRSRWKWDAPSWGVSLLVHASILTALALMVVGGQIQQAMEPIDAAMVDTAISEQQAEELVKILSDPTEAQRELASGDPLSLSAGARPSATPAIRSEMAEVSESKSLQGLVSVAVPTPSTSLLPPTPTLNRDLSGGNRIGGDVGRETTDYGEALDQIAREILAHLANHRVTVLWMFDESGSMKDDQRTVRDKFDRVLNELKIRVPADRRASGDLEHAIIGFGQTIHFESSKPRSDLEHIRSTIDKLPVDETGEEQTMSAILEAIGRYNRVIGKDRKVLLVLVTDESGDDGDLVEQARLALVNRGVTVYVLGRQAMFGYDRVHLRYVDPVTGDVYWPTIRRGPESAGLELLQWDGLHHNRRDEQPSGFAPYELARLVEDTGGIFFLLPNEEELRNRPRGEKAYSIAALKEYVPDYGPRPEYSAKIAKSDLRRAMVEIIYLTKEGFGFRDHFPVAVPEFAQAVAEEVPKVNTQLMALLEFEKRLRALEPERNTEADRRWQANYDLMLGLIVAFQVKAYEYRACLEEMVQLARQGKLRPEKPPIPGRRRTDWIINHSRKTKAPAKETEKKYAQAKALLTRVIERHPGTPWADLAQRTLNHGLGCDWSEWHVHPDYDKRAKLVPKY